MKKYWFILATLFILFLFGCSPTIIHKHYHYYPDGIAQCDTQAPCSMNKAKQMHGGKKHGGQHCIQHIGKKPCANHAGMQHGDKKPCPKMQAAKHGKMKHCDKKPGMKHGCKKHMSHGHKGIVEKPCNADCPRGCQHGPSDNCPNRNDEQLEELFTEEAK